MRYQELQFRIAPEVTALGLRGAYFTMGGLFNRAPGDPAYNDFNALKAETLAAIVPELSAESIKSDPVLTGFRELHRAVGSANRKTIPAPENLLRVLHRTGALHSVNMLVDIYNLVSVKTRLALGAHDLAQVSGDIQLRLTDGGEGFHPLGEGQPKSIVPGEYAYVDGANDVLCRMEVRQVEKSKVDPGTTECFHIVQGNAATSAQKLKEATEEWIALTQRFCGGEARMLHAPWENG